MDLTIYNEYMATKYPIKIHNEFYGNNLCFVCNKPYKHFISNKKKAVDELYETDIKICHPVCNRLIQKQNKLKNDLLNIEWLIFCKKF